MAYPGERESAGVPAGGLCSASKGRQLPISGSWWLHAATVECESRARCTPPTSARLARVRLSYPLWPRRSAFPAPQPLLPAPHGGARGLSPTGPAGGITRPRPGRLGTSNPPLLASSLSQSQSLKLDKLIPLADIDDQRRRFPTASEVEGSPFFAVEASLGGLGSERPAVEIPSLYSDWYPIVFRVEPNTPAHNVFAEAKPARNGPPSAEVQAGSTAVDAVSARLRTRVGQLR